MQPILFELGPITVYSYGVFVVFGVITAVGVSYLLARKARLSLIHFSDRALATVFAALLGARISYLLMRPDEAGNLLNWFALGGGRLALVGGVVAGGLTLAYLIRRDSSGSGSGPRVQLSRWFDVVAIAAVAGLAVGRIGSFLNGDYLGTPTGLPWGAHYDESPALTVVGRSVHPLALYAAIVYAAIAAYGYRLWKLSSAADRSGLVLWVIVLLVGVAQVVLEAFHQPIDALRIGGMRTAILFGLALVAVSVWVLATRYRVGRSARRSEPHGGGRR